MEKKNENFHLNGKIQNVLLFFYATQQRLKRMGLRIEG